MMPFFLKSILDMFLIPSAKKIIIENADNAFSIIINCFTQNEFVNLRKYCDKL